MDKYNARCQEKSDWDLNVVLNNPAGGPPKYQ